MKKENQKVLDRIAYTYTKLANFTNEEAIKNRLEQLYNLEEDDVIDKVLITIYDFVSRGKIDKEVAIEYLDMVCGLNKDKYPKKEDLWNRLYFLRSMNLIYTDMPLKENHKLVVEAFDAFNSLIGTDFDAYYTGGMMGYLAAEKDLVRYHSDLDLLISEDELEKLKKLVDESEDFEFISCMRDKDNTGHEYVIRYKDTRMCIGLFLFERKNEGMVRNSYYYKGDKLLVDREYIPEEYVNLTYVDKIYSHNDIPFKMVSLESIYSVKRNGRVKDQYDAEIIKDNVDMEIVGSIEESSKDIRRVDGIDASKSIVSKIENKRIR